MKKPRGKQPTKPDLQKALRKRDMELKGADKASLTVPIIYRRTFGWDHPGVTFVPINHRGFVIFRGDLDSEEYKREMYTKITLDINNLPHYSKTRALKNDETSIVELNEAILAASLKDRYVQISIPKPKDAKLYEYLKKDMEMLVTELGFEYSTDHMGIQCIFKFPKHDLKYYAMESKVCVQAAIRTLNHFRSMLGTQKFQGAAASIDDLVYNINRLKLLMDRYYSDSLNRMWDLPNISNPGYFLWINSCERILDEFLIITRETKNAIQSLKPDDIQHIGMDKDIFGYVWEKVLENCLEFCSTAISSIELMLNDKNIQDAFFIQYHYEHHRKSVQSSQSKFIKLLDDGSTSKDTARMQRIKSASYHLNNIFQATEHIIVFSTAIAKNTLRIGLYNDE